MTEMERNDYFRQIWEASQRDNGHWTTGGSGLVLSTTRHETKRTNNSKIQRIIQWKEVTVKNTDVSPR